MPSANWHCKPNGILITGIGRGDSISRNPAGGSYVWSNSLGGYIDSAITGGVGYTYTAPEGSTDPPCMKGICSATAGSFLNYGFSISREPGDDQSTIEGEYQLVVPRYAVVNEYIHDNASILDGRWQHANTLPPPDADTKGQAVGAWLFQSSVSTLSVIARERSSQGGSDFLVGYEVSLDKTPREWAGPVRLVADTGPLNGVTSQGAFLLTNFDEENLFHLLVAREDEASLGSRIEHYTQQSSILGQWTHVATLQPPSDVPGTTITGVTFVQSSQGKFEAVARVTPPNGGDNYLVGYELDVANHQQEWSPPFRLVTDIGDPFVTVSVTGSPIIIESNFGDEDRFHLLVPTKVVPVHGPVHNPVYGTVHYTLPVGSFTEGKWTRFATLSPPFPNLPVTAVSVVENLAGEFEAVTRIQGPQRDEVVVGYNLKPGTTEWYLGGPLAADDGPILIGKP
jgi:hypothetical protein